MSNAPNPIRSKGSSLLVIGIAALLGYSLFFMTLFVSTSMEADSTSPVVDVTEDIIMIDEDASLILRHHHRVARGHLELGEHISTLVVSASE